MEQVKSKTLIRQRAAFKAVLTKMRNWVEAIEIKKGNGTAIQKKLVSLEELGEKMENVYFELIKVSDEEGINNAEQDFELFEENVNSVRAELLNKLKLINELGVTDNEAVIAENVLASGHNDEFKEQYGIEVKLPQMNLIKFNGDLQNWIKFYENFKTLIHNNMKLRNVQKFYYLTNCLEGEAAQVIDSIEMSDENYSFAWETLVDNYKNNKILIEFHVNNLFKAKKMEGQSSKALKELLQVFQKNLNALRKLNIPVEHCDVFLIHLFTARLDNLSLKAWEENSSKKEISSYENLENFIKERCVWLKSYEDKNSVANKREEKGGKDVNYYNRNRVGNLKEQGKYGCLSVNAVQSQTQQGITKQNKNKIVYNIECCYCESKEHQVLKCKQFLNLSVSDKREAIQNKGLCWLCLKGKHKASQCYSGDCCSHCKGRHNSLICRVKELEENKLNNRQKVEIKDKELNSDSAATHCATNHRNVNKITKGTILPTASVNFRGQGNKICTARVILDSGSQLNFISKRVVSQLNLKISKEQLEVKALGNMSLFISESVEIIISSCVTEFKRKVKLYILPEVSNLSNSNNLQINKDSLPQSIKENLADSKFNCSENSVDGLLNASFFFDIILPEKYYLHNNSNSFDLMFINTELGWVCAGDCTNESEFSESLLTLNSMKDKSCNKLNKIKQNQDCEAFFLDSLKIGSDGRYIVSLPTVMSPKLLGSSYEGASQRFFSLEQKFKRNFNLKTDYVQFMTEYLKLGHMEEVPQDEIVNEVTYYLPHHAVCRESITTKLRVVFDASFKTDRGLSLNDILATGPTLQNDIFNILIQFRFPKYGLTADVMKMYRQIWVNSEQADLQRIVWRESPELPLSHYRLKTITYGTSSAPYLAIRCLHQIAKEIEDEKPGLAQIIKNNFYMDDLICGASSTAELIQLQNQLAEIFNKRGFFLRKYASNSLELKNKLPKDETGQVCIILGDNDTIKALGLTWDTNKDEFILQFDNVPTTEIITKRKIVSDLHTFWDPLGFLSPIFIKGKMFVQELWQLKLSWDDPLPDKLQQKWTKFRADIKQIDLMTLPRRVIIDDTEQLEFHCFCDASERAYGGCIYIVSRKNGNCSSQLLCAKSKVAPLECGSLPRLELMAASLVNKLMETVVQAVNIPNMKIYYWSDSEIVLTWLTGYPREWKAFVANRVAIIRETSTPEQWNYVPSKQNPADLVSRGVQSKGFKTNNFWWHGPEWLRTGKQTWPVNSQKRLEEVPERRKLTFSLLLLDDTFKFVNNYSNWIKLLHIAAYMFRFINNLRNSVKNRAIGVLKLSEINKAKLFILKIVQGTEYADEITRLRANLQIKRESKLSCLSVYLDKEGLLRVGGRLKNAEIPENRKYPILLPYKAHVTQLIISYYHKIFGHIGPQGLLSVVRGEYWPINGKSACKAIVHMCMTCKRDSPTTIYPKMGHLPKERVTPGRPFDVCGVDFCGPIWIKVGTRKSVKQKAYIALFICFKVKAVHIELVSDLTSSAFIAALRRFYARRGVSAHMFSDNGTNFVGAQRELKLFIQNAKIQEESVKVGTEWHFIPPGAPHMGGLWESAIKLLKTHLRKILKSDILTFEETYTVLAQIEAIMNSRPLCSLSDDPSDPTPLTPSHFLVGSPLKIPNEPDLTDKTPIIKRWQRIQQLVQIFWKRWNLEYLTSLQTKYKWKFKRTNLLIGTLVAIKDNDVPPAQWKLGRITNVYPGNDGVVRVASVKLGTGTETRRPIVKLCPLLGAEEDNPWRRLYDQGRNEEAI